ncbi:MAG TPA: acyl-CoA dehydrogenase family protein [Alphaproteobacteria bacterium]|jgi:alkylation response protein AidB-like acyl-CoA dehydrogenase|nr:acyl-CoA dehydrogenase family protein [Alphaproteobacteria bacterium]
MDFGFTEEQELMRDSVIKLMQRAAPPELVRRHDRDRTFPYELYDAWVEAGLLKLPFPEEVGGLGGSAVDVAIVVEELSRVSTDLTMAYSGSVFCGLNILRHGTAEQKRHWLPHVMSGAVKLAIGISEPDAGSDVGALKTFARRDGDRWIVNGQKLWTTGAGLKGSVISTYVRTDRDAHYRNGLSLLLIDNDTPGVELRKLDMLGRRCAGTYEVFFRDVEVPDDRLIGGVNRGWDALMSGLQYERAVSAAGSCGGARAVLELAVAYAKERVQFGRPIGSFQAIGHALADLATEVDAARMLTWRAAWLVATGQDALREITMAKLFASETYVKAANLGVQVMGAYGLNAEFDMQRHFRDAKSATIAAGTSETQRNLIAGLIGLKPK